MSDGDGGRTSLLALGRQVEEQAVQAPVILIDGRSGSGKTALAEQLVADLRAGGETAELLRVEDLYPGWNGLAAGAEQLPEVLRTREYRRYDWYRGCFLEDRERLSGVRLVIEGCGAITAASLEAAAAYGGSVRPSVDSRNATCSVWLDCPTELRRERALARDGDTYAPHWDDWAAQEDEFFGRHRPWELAHFRLDCASGAASQGR
ncbi:AAA family ATPase [Leucobacter sp. GX24907]